MEHEQSQRVKRTQRDYSFAFKMMVVHKVEKEQLTYKQVQETYGIQGKSIVFIWLRKFGLLKTCQNHLNAQSLHNKEYVN